MRCLSGGWIVIGTVVSAPARGHGIGAAHLGPRPELFVPLVVSVIWWFLCYVGQVAMMSTRRRHCRAASVSAPGGTVVWSAHIVVSPMPRGSGRGTPLSAR